MITTAKNQSSIDTEKFHRVELIDCKGNFLVDGLGLYWRGRQRRLPLGDPVQEERIERAAEVIRKLPRLKHPGHLDTGNLKVFVEGVSGYVCNGSTIIACYRLGIPMRFDGMFPRVAIEWLSVIDRFGCYRKTIIPQKNRRRL